MFGHKGLLGEGFLEPTTQRCPNLFMASGWRVVFIPFRHLFLEKKRGQVMIYQLALDSQSYREVMIYIGYVFHGLGWWMLMNFNTAVEQMGCLGASFRGNDFFPTNLFRTWLDDNRRISGTVTRTEHGCFKFPRFNSLQYRQVEKPYPTLFSIHRHPRTHTDLYEYSGLQQI